MPLRVVYDCMVYLQATTKESTGPAAACLRLAEQGTVRPLLSPEVLRELKEVFSRPELRRKFKALTASLAAQFLEHLVALSENVPEAPKAFSLPRDPDDEIYTNLAIAGGAEYLVTWNDRHLNYLMKGDTPEGKDFRARYPSLKIVTPPMFLDEVRRRLGRETSP